MAAARTVLGADMILRCRMDMETLRRPFTRGGL